MPLGDVLDRAFDPATTSGTNSPDTTPALFTLDGDGRLTKVSLRLARLVGACTSDLEGSPLIDLLDPLDSAAFLDRLFDLLAGADGVELETRLLHADGSRFGVRLDLLGGAESFSGSLTPLGGTGVSASFARSHALLDVLPGMVLVSDAAGKPLYSNAELRRRFGRPMGGGLGGLSLIHNEDRSGAHAAWQEALIARAPFTHDLRMAAFGEPFRWIRLRTQPSHDDSGNVLFWISALTDIEEERATECALAEARHFIARFGEASPDVIFLFDRNNGSVIYCSEASTKVLGYTPAEMRAMGASLLPTVIHPDDWSWISEEMLLCAARNDPSEEAKSIEYRAVRKDGETIWLSSRILPFDRGREGRSPVCLGISQDVTLRRVVETERDDHTRILEHALSGVGVLDKDGRYVYANTEYAGVSGRSPSDLVGRIWTDCVHGDDIERMQSEYERMLWSGRVEAECRGVRPDGAVYHQHVVMIPKYDGELFAGHYRFVRDVTERVRFQGQLESQLAHISSMSAELEQRSNELQCANAILAQQAGSDSLTALSNHRVLQETLQTLNETGRPHSLLLFDVDHFKAYNDAFGHPAGDVVLKEFASTLEDMTVKGELSARYGGEEFALVLPDVDLEGAEVRAGLILNRISETHWPHRMITASVGCAMWAPGRSRADLIEAADRALYISKRNGRNRVTAAA